MSVIAPTSEHSPSSHHEHAAEHIVPISTYLAIFLALMVLTAATVGASEIDLGRFNVLVALAIAITKATLVILFFMHVWYSSRLTMIVLATAFFWLGVMIVLTLSDVLSRGWLGFPGG
jgi:cytochrome c oxidase subunit 4